MPALVGLGVAADLAREALPRFSSVKTLRDEFESALQREADDDDDESELTLPIFRTKIWLANQFRVSLE